MLKSEYSGLRCYWHWFNLFPFIYFFDVFIGKGKMMCGLNALPFGQCWPRTCSPLEPLFLTNVPPGWSLTRGYKNSNSSLLTYPIRICKFLWKILEYCILP